MSSHCGQTRLDWMDTLAMVLWSRPSFEHSWHVREQDRSDMHPAIREAVLLAPPADWHRLVLEWAHVSVSDPARLAFTRSVEHGEANRQTVTSISKYLTSNFPSLQSHVIRDICAKFGNHCFKISWQMNEMLELLAQSPRSCMRWDRWSAGEWHPYQCYAPEFGWGLAVRLENDQVMARALVNKSNMTFVRSFGAINNDRGHSQNDNALNSYLKSIGYTHANGWDGLRIAKIDHPDGGWTAPYLDGYNQRVESRNGYFLISDNGEYECTQTDGSIENEDRASCECCGDYINLNSGNHSWAGRFEDYLVCEHCCDNSFVRAYGADQEQYLTDEGNCQHIDGEYYVTRFFSDNGIVFAVDTDEYCHEDDCLFLDHRQEWVSSDCSYAVFCESSGNHEHVDDCFVDDDGEYVLIDDQSSEAAA